jgi:NADPH:quinone reductase-like Zn-dependent oxidoreductase
MGYPLVPGYESVGRIVEAGRYAKHRVGQQVFVPGARCFGAVRGLFGGAAARVVVQDERVYEVGAAMGDRAVLLALAWATLPLQVSSVLYVVQRMELMAATAVLLGLLAYHRGRAGLNAGDARGWAWLVGAGGIALVGVGAKESAALFFAYVLVAEAHGVCHLVAAHAGLQHRGGRRGQGDGESPGRGHRGLLG